VLDSVVDERARIDVADALDRVTRVHHEVNMGSVGKADLGHDLSGLTI
jgi:hypothetical protein